jgi:pyruvate dehydrogenase E1 component alpha subunit
MNVLAIRKVAKESIKRDRQGEGSTLIEDLTYIFRCHSLADPDELRSYEEKQACFMRDTTNQLRIYLLSTYKTSFG